MVPWFPHITFGEIYSVVYNNVEFQTEPNLLFRHVTQTIFSKIFIIIWKLMGNQILHAVLDVHRLKYTQKLIDLSSSVCVMTIGMSVKC